MAVEKEALPALAKEEFYWHHYIGRSVADKNGMLGSIEEIFYNGAQDVFVVRTVAGDEILIPVTENTILLEKDDQLLVDLPPGLVELNRENDDL